MDRLSRSSCSFAATSAATTSAMRLRKCSTGFGSIALTIWQNWDCNRHELDATRSGIERNRLGQFATPSSVAIDIVRYVDSLLSDRHRAIRFADPALGTGSFFYAALAVFGPKRIQSALGIEIDPAFCDAARG